MRNFLWLKPIVAIIIAIGGLNVTCRAQKITGIDIKPVYKGVFKDTLDYVIWRDTVITLSYAKKLGTKGIEGVKEQWVNILYPKVVFVIEKRQYETGATQDIIKAIRFVDINGKIKNELREKPYEIDLGNINVSKNKRYICITTWTKKKFITKIRNQDTGMMEDCEAPLFESRIYNTDGILLRTIKQRNSYAYVSPNGEYVVGSGAFEDDGDITMYNEKGFIIGIERNRGSWDIDFSDDGRWFAITRCNINYLLLKNAKTREEKAKAWSSDLIVMDENGKELWRKLNLTYGGAAHYCPVKIDSNNEVIVFTGLDDYRKYIFTKQGYLIESKKCNLEQLRNFKRGR